jgi:hypothetical protein
MKTLKWYAFTLCIGLLIYGCASFPKADSGNNTLVVGTIVQEGTGYQYYGSVSINGTNKGNIDITLQELVSEKIYTMRTRNDGFFYSVNIPEGTYKLTRVYLRNDAGSSWASISWTPGGARTFEILDGKVNNLGAMRWKCEQNVTNSLSYNIEYGQVRNFFQDKYKSSNWNEKEWINTSIKRE